MFWQLCWLPSWFVKLPKDATLPWWDQSSFFVTTNMKWIFQCFGNHVGCHLDLSNCPRMLLCPGGISLVYMQHEAWNIAKPLKSNRWYFFWVRPEIAIWQTHYTPLIVLTHILCIFYAILNTITMYAFFRLWHIMLCKNYRARQATERNKYRKDNSHSSACALLCLNRLLAVVFQ